jgi:putative hemolysin
MTPAELAIALVLLLAGFTLSALFSGIETGVYTINRVRLNARVAAKRPRAVRLQHELVQPRRMLATLLIGNNAANYAGSFGLALLLAGLGCGDWEVVGWQALLVTPMLFVFGETLPKDLFRTHTDHWTYSLSRFLQVSRWISTATGMLPIVMFVSGLINRFTGMRDGQTLTRRQRVSALVREGIGSGVITETQTTLVDRALALRALKIRSEMVPWSRVVSLRLVQSTAAALDVFARHGWTRMPVCDTQGRVQGMVSALDVILQPDRSLQALMKDVPRFPPTIGVWDALQTMRTEHASLAVIEDAKTRKPLGIVTMKDLVEPLTGDLAAW